MNKIYTVKQYEQAIEDRERIKEKFEVDKVRETGVKKPLKRKLAKIEAALANFTLYAKNPAVSKGKPEYSWKRAKRFTVSLEKT